MITEKEAISLLKKYNLRKDGIQHMKGCSKFAYNLASRIKAKNPNIEINPEKIKIATLLHDIGKCQGEPHEFHTIDILMKEGLAGIAKIVMHGFAYEYSILNGKPDFSLLPVTIENKILVYSDFRFLSQPITLKNRFNELRKRKSNNEEFIKALNMAEPRFIIIEKEIFELID